MFIFQKIQRTKKERGELEFLFILLPNLNFAIRTISHSIKIEVLRDEATCPRT